MVETPCPAISLNALVRFHILFIPNILSGGECLVSTILMELSSTSVCARLKGCLIVPKWSRIDGASNDHHQSLNKIPPAGALSCLSGYDADLARSLRLWRVGSIVCVNHPVMFSQLLAFSTRFWLKQPALSPRISPLNAIS